MSAVFDGREIWSSEKLVYPPLSKEDEEKWERIQKHCRQVAAFSIQYAVEEDERWAKTRAEFGVIA